MNISSLSRLHTPSSHSSPSSLTYSSPLLSLFPLFPPPLPLTPLLRSLTSLSPPSPLLLHTSLHFLPLSPSPTLSFPHPFTSLLPFLYFPPQLFLFFHPPSLQDLHFPHFLTHTTSPLPSLLTLSNSPSKGHRT